MAIHKSINRNLLHYTLSDTLTDRQLVDLPDDKHLNSHHILHIHTQSPALHTQIGAKYSIQINNFQLFTR